MRSEAAIPKRASEKAQERDRNERKGLEAKAHGDKEGGRDSMIACLAEARREGL